MTDQTEGEGDRIELNDGQFANALPQGVVVSYRGGACPYQAEGTVDGFPFYFRSRGTNWSLHICLNQAAGDYLAWPRSADQWHHREKYSDEMFAAGWIADSEAAAFITKAVELFRTKTDYDAKIIKGKTLDEQKQEQEEIDRVRRLLFRDPPA